MASSSSEDEDRLDDYLGKNGLMFLIDFREDMFDVDPKTGISNFRACLNTCKTVLLEIAKSGKDDLIGVSLIGTKKGTSDSLSLLANIQPLESVSVNRIKEIDQIIVDEGDNLKDKYGQMNNTETLTLVKVLNSCLKLFVDCKKKIYNKTIVLMTNDDYPVNDAQSAHLARKQAKKLSYAYIDLIVVGLGDKFESNKFYNELISIARGELDKDWAKTDRVKRLGDIDNHLLSLMSRLSRTHRDLWLSDSVSIPISLYKLYKEPKIKMKRAFLPNAKEDLDDDDDRDNNAAGPSKVVPNTNVSKAIGPYRVPAGKRDMIALIGGKTVNITRGELAEARLKTGVGLKLVGFIATQDVPEYLSVKPPRVMLPNYFSPGGIRAFKCLLEQCSEDQVSMICWYQYTKFSSPSLAVCHPMSEQSDSKGNVCPNGFCVVSLPFDDNYSDPELRKLDVEPSEKQTTAAQAIVKKLGLTYTTDIFHDYEHMRTLAMMEALALDYDDIPEVIDDTIFDDGDLDERIQNYVDDFTDCSHIGPFDTVSAKKRPASGCERASKNPKLDTVDGLIDLIKEGKANMLTIAQLKQALDSQAIHYSSSFKKPQLIELANKQIK